MAKTVAVVNEQSSGMERLKSRPQEFLDFLKDVRSEMRKVVAPTRTVVQSTTTIVIVTVFIFAAYFFVVDSIVGRGVTQLINHFTH